ncbi:MAG: TetR/AcrR family transcriptional regulator [Betaproteobacteria bacterium]|nr:TetR/AcrR family transcriptional regulator [Betaproteobacteria bacterium]
MAQRQKAATARHDELLDRIVDAAIALGEEKSWEAVRLHGVADALGITLDDVRRHFREKEDVVDAWFDRADAAMLRESEAPDFQNLTPRQRVHRLIMTWLGALAAHRKVTRQMIYGKLEPGHIHILFPGLMRVSRTVQWVRESAHRDATYARRALEETGLTTIYLMTFFYWMNDDSPESASTSRFLDGWLGLAERLDRAVYGGPRGAAEKPAGKTAPQRAPDGPAG